MGENIKFDHKKTTNNNNGVCIELFMVFVHAIFTVEINLDGVDDVSV